MNSTEKLTLYMGTQKDGYVFRPRPKSRVWLEEHYPDKPRVSSVFIGFDKGLDSQQIPDAIWRQVWVLLTGLSDSELIDVATKQTAGLLVFDPMSNQEIPQMVFSHV
ncbi:MAG: hypothetical protein AAF639_24915 [Chloroflexota bacterium]